MAALASSAKANSSSQDSGPSSVPFRGSSIPKSRKSASAPKSATQSRSTSSSGCSTWLLIDADDSAFPFLQTLHTTSADVTSLTSGSISPAARSSEKLTESTDTVTAKSNHASRTAPASSNVRSQASKYENSLVSSTTENGSNAISEKDRRMSLSQGQAGTLGRKGFMSRLRGGGSVSSANVFNNPSPSTTTPLPKSESWSLVDPPTPMKDGGAGSQVARTVHVAFSASATDAAIQQAKGLLARSTTSLLPTVTQEPQVEEHIYSNRHDLDGLTKLVQLVRPEAIYMGSARTSLSQESIQQVLEAVLSSATSPLKLIIVDPASVRQLTVGQASSLSEVARTHSVSLSLPIRWASLSTATIDETLLGLELLHDIEAEQAHSTVEVSSSADSADTSVDKSFDISMSNIPTGLSHDNLSKLAELEEVKAQMAQLHRDILNKDKRIQELVKQNEEQGRIMSASKEPVTPGARSAPATAVTPAQSPAAATDAAPILSPIAEPQTPVSAPKAQNTPSANVSRFNLPVRPVRASPLRTPGLAPAADITSPSSPGSPSRSSGKVIASLTSELAETKATLEATRAALNTVKAQSAQYQAQADEMRGTLSRARLENDSSVTILARKDRQISEALERARKAEAEAKELGRASREWGTRVREVEEELGKERMKRARAEQQYDSLSSEWKTARERLREEVKELRESHAEQLQKLSEEYKKVLTFKDKLKEEWSGYTPEDGEGEGKALGPQRLVAEIKGVNARMQEYLQKEVSPLMKGLKELEKRENKEIVHKLEYLTDELTRIKTLMRRGDVTSSTQVPPGPL